MRRLNIIKIFNSTLYNKQPIPHLIGILLQKLYNRYLYNPQTIVFREVPFIKIWILEDIL